MDIHVQRKARSAKHSNSFLPVTWYKPNMLRCRVEKPDSMFNKRIKRSYLPI